MSSKKKQKSCPFSSSKSRPKKGKKAFGSEVAEDLTLSLKGFSSTKMNVEEHEQKLDTSEKKSDFAGIFTDLDRIPRERCFFYCVICFL